MKRIRPTAAEDPLGVAIDGEKRIVCVEDQNIVIRALSMFLDREPDMQVVGKLAAADQLVEMVELTDANVVTLDLDMPGADPIEALRELKRKFPDVVVLIFSGVLRPAQIKAALEAGASGYFCKTDDFKALIDGIRGGSKERVTLGPSARDALDRSHAG